VRRLSSKTTKIRYELKRWTIRATIPQTSRIDLIWCLCSPTRRLSGRSCQCLSGRLPKSSRKVAHKSLITVKLFGETTIWSDQTIIMRLLSTNVIKRLTELHYAPRSRSSNPFGAGGVRRRQQTRARHPRTGSALPTSPRPLPSWPLELRS